MQTFISRERVAFFETDAAGIIHFMFALRYFEIGEREALRVAGIKHGDVRRGGVPLPRVHVSCDYHQPLYYDDEIEIHTTCMAIGNASIDWNFKIFRNDELCISGGMTVVLLDEKSGKSRRIPDDWRRKLVSGTENME